MLTMCIGLFASGFEEGAEREERKEREREGLCSRVVPSLLLFPLFSSSE
jgi:hypothetical protein